VFGRELGEFLGRLMQCRDVAEDREVAALERQRMGKGVGIVEAPRGGEAAGRPSRRRLAVPDTYRLTA